MFRYACYGVSLNSAYPLGVPTASKTPSTLQPCVEICRGKAGDFFAISSNGHARAQPERWFQYRQLSDGSDYVRWTGLFEFMISREGKRIVTRAFPRASLEALQTYLSNHVLSFALLKLGLESLHATTMVIEEKAVAFLGSCGAGKSTLAAHSLQAGYRLLTDDLLVLTREDGQPLLAYPGLSRIKLMPSVATRLLGHQARGGRMNPFTAKLVIPLQPAQCASAPTTLQAIYVLRASHRRDHAQVVIEPLSPCAAWQALTQGIFNTIVHEPWRLAQQFRWTTQLARTIPVKSLRYPRRLKQLDDVLRAILEDLADESS